MPGKRTPLQAKRDLKEVALDSAKLRLQFATTPNARRRAMDEIDRLKAALGKR